MSDTTDPFGRSTRRSARLSDEETARRMLDAGVRMVGKSGLQLSFDLLRLEDVIEAADVSRSAVYRKWPSKAYYFADLLRELAGATHPVAAAYDQGTVALAAQVAEESLDLLRTPDGRHIALVEMCRRGALENFNAISGAQNWRTYVALQATLLSLPEELALQEDLAAILRKSEEWFVARMSAFYEAMTEVVGYRLRSISTVGFDTLATLGAAVVEGLAVKAITIPEVADRRFKADPFKTGVPSEWSLPALGFTSIVMTLVEPDEPSGDWDDQQIERVQQTLRDLLSTAQVTA